MFLKRYSLDENMLEIISFSSESLLVRLIAALVILLVGYILGKFLGKLVKRILGELETNRILKEQAGVKVLVEEFFSKVTSYIVYFVAVIMALSQLGLSTFVLHSILVVILIIIVAFIILAVKDFIPNVMAGFFIHQKRMMNEGEKIKVDSVEGEIVHVGLVETKIKNKKGETVYVPNSILTKHIVRTKK